MEDTNFRIRRDEINVTSSCRPDTSWKFVDKAGHTHCYYEGDRPATNYNPSLQYSVPSMSWVSTDTEYHDDGDGYFDEYEGGYYACDICGEEVHPGTTSDTFDTYIAGLKHYYIGNREVGREEFRSAYLEQTGETLPDDV